MALKTFKPTTASRRGTVLVDRSHLSKVRPHAALTLPKKQQAGRNNAGRITVRHKGGVGVKKSYRVLDFKRDKYNVPAVVETLEYDPNRTAFIALLKYADGDRRYIIAPEGLEVGMNVVSSNAAATIQVGNAMPLKEIPQGTLVNSVELMPGAGAKIGRSAGSQLQVMGSDKGYTILRVPSGEIRVVKETCMATIGAVSNQDHKNVKLGSAGRSRRMGIRPGVRGVAMSYKHPHGSGQGKSGRHGTGGPAKDRWGNKVGARTRRHRRTTSKFIIRRRPATNKFKKYKTVI